MENILVTEHCKQKKKTHINSQMQQFNLKHDGAEAKVKRHNIKLEVMVCLTSTCKSVYFAVLKLKHGPWYGLKELNVCSDSRNELSRQLQE